MTIFDSLLLGTVQGLTEFLPVSSSGHLILMRELLGINTSGGLAFDAVLQLGTILAVFVVFWKTIKHLALVVAPGVLLRRTKNLKTEDIALFVGLLIGTVPALILGLLLEDLMETTFRSPLIVACMLIVGSILFFVAERFAKQTQEHPTVSQSWWVGCFQTLALIPGMSRSGATISGGLLLGLTRSAAARLSFLLSLPIITGSGLKKILDIVQDRPADFDILSLVIGFVTAFGVGLFCIRFLLRYLEKHTLSVFAWYRIGLATVVIAALFITKG
jgi:undecaprenyl-diphosphatase